MKVPAAVEVAFSCAPLRAVPYVIAAGAAQVMAGVTCVIGKSSVHEGERVVCRRQRALGGRDGIRSTVEEAVAVVVKLALPVTALLVSPFTKPLRLEVNCGFAAP